MEHEKITEIFNWWRKHKNQRARRYNVPVIYILLMSHFFLLSFVPCFTTTYGPVKYIYDNVLYHICSVKLNYVFPRHWDQMQKVAKKSSNIIGNWSLLQDWIIVVRRWSEWKSKYICRKEKILRCQISGIYRQKNCSLGSYQPT